MENKNLVIQLMKETNPWWESPFTVHSFFSRDIYEKILSFLPTRQAIALVGLRRVGKTTLLLKVIENYLANGFPAENIFYFSFDEFSHIHIRDALDLYQEIIKKGISESKYLFLFDEVQKLDGWAEQVKRLYDAFSNIKIFVSGSESLFIRKGATESLAGRLFEFLVEPLSFKEFLSFRGFVLKNLALQRGQIVSEFRQYLLCSGFPELVRSEKEVITKYINEGIIDKVIFRDLSEITDVKSISLLKSAFSIIYNNPGQIIEVQSLAQELGISRHSLSDYLTYLEKAFLVKKLFNFSRNARKTERRLKKYYSTINNPLLAETDFPRIFEQSIINQLKAEYFWRDAYKNEVDAVMLEPLCAVEIKSGAVKEKDVKPLLQFQQKFRPKKAMVLSFDAEATFGKVPAIPFYKYFLER